MQLENIQDLLGTNLKSVKTFAAKAKYEYAVEGSTYIIVEKGNLRNHPRQMIKVKQHNDSSDQIYFKV